MVKRAWDEWPGREGDPERQHPKLASLSGRAPRLATVDGAPVPRGLPGSPDPMDDWQEIPTADGGVIIRFGGPELLDNNAGEEYDEDEGFYDNLALIMGDAELAAIGEELIDAINSDIQSMSGWMSNYERGMTVLGTEQKQPRGEATGEGVSVVDHPLLLEATILEQSNACGELLPAMGPIKIDNSGHATAITDEDATTLEKDLNEYLTVHRPEYVPDTERMLFQRGFGGMTFKKVFHCPLRRAPVSDSVAPGDLIVNNTAKSLEDAGRITHRIKMRPALVKRMQFVGAYRDVDLQTPVEDLTGIERKTATIAGVKPNTDRQQDVDFTIYECCCELDMPGDEHMENGKVTGLPRPYIVTIEKDTRQILEIRRNWVKDDALFTARRRFIAFPYLPMFGFYASGLLTVLGNTTTALTAGWRILIDAGMFGNFPGGMYLKNGERQQDNNFRAAPGEFAPVDGGGTDDIRKVIAPYPYREPGPATQAFFKEVETTGQRVGGTVNIAVAEGKADAPVGTVLAALEQVSKMISATHRRAHTSQALEFQTLLELIREKPEDFVKYFVSKGFWSVERLLRALDNWSFIPRADPNTPTQIHRIIKSMGLKQLEMASPDRYDGKKVDAHIMRTALSIDDPEEFFAPPAPQGALPPDPTLAVANLVAQTEALKTASRERVEQFKAQLQASLKQMELQERGRIEGEKIAATREKTASGETVAAMKEEGATERELMKLEGQAVIGDAEREHATSEATANRDSAERVAADRNKTTTTVAKMRPKPQPGGSSGSKKK
jgi:hypothetical protein